MKRRVAIALLASSVPSVLRAEVLEVPSGYPTIQAAVDAAVEGDEIVVAPGTYHEAVDLLGKAVTLRSSDGPAVTAIDATGLDSSVIYCSSFYEPVIIIEGFTITGGVASGLYSDKCQPTVCNCVFTANEGFTGGGIYSYADQDGYYNVAELNGCTFVGNVAEWGGGVYLGSVKSSVKLVQGCTFTDNIAVSGYGGGLFLDYGTISVTNSAFHGNDAPFGGGLSHFGFDAVIANNRFTGNTAEEGAAIYLVSSKATISNCTLTGNIAESGGGIYNAYSGVPTIANSILWGNAPDEIVDDGFTVSVVGFSDVQGGWVGEGNIDLEPFFVDADGMDDILGTPDDDLHLSSNSPCIDVGSNASIPDGIVEDTDGNPRIGDGDYDGLPITDLGAYELPGDCNGNDVFDAIDIEEGFSADCDGNLVPDECETDCNVNGLNDVCDLASGASTDCNTNTVPDECDIASGVSLDLNGSGLPDECEAECLPSVKLAADDGGSGDSFGYSVGILGSMIIVGAKDDDDLALNAGAAYVFTHNGDNWVQTQKIIPLGGAAQARFGKSIALDEDTLVIGADGGGGSAYVFGSDGAQWVQEQKLTAPDPGGGDLFGFSLGLSGNALVIGAYHDDDQGSDSGSAYVFRYDGTTWKPQQKLHPTDGASMDYFGFGLSIDLDLIAVGSYGDDDNGERSGSAYVFRYDGFDWVQEQKLLADDGAVEDNFGNSVALEGDTLFVGATGADGEDYNGAVYVFRYDGSTWEQSQKLFDDDVAGFGGSLALSGPTAVVGAGYDDSYQGSAHVYINDGLEWAHQQVLRPESAYFFGYAAALWETSAVIGAYLDDGKGSAFIFDVSLTDCNGNSFPDGCDLALGTSKDSDGNSVPDECDADPCPGDANGDGAVDPLDSGFVLAHFGCPVGTGDDQCDASDQNANGAVDPLDVGFVLARFGDCV